jgi:hypothetical protein
VSTTLAQIARVRSESGQRDADAIDWMRAVLAYGAPLGALLLEADAASLTDLPMSGRGAGWDTAYAKAEALTGHAWRLGETHEIAIRHLWGLWAPSDMHEWRVFRNQRAREQVEADYFNVDPTNT